MSLEINLKQIFDFQLRGRNAYTLGLPWPVCTTGALDMSKTGNPL